MSRTKSLNPLSASIIACAFLFILGIFLLAMFVQEERTNPKCTIYKYDVIDICKNIENKNCTIYKIYLECTDGIRRLQYTELDTIPLIGQIVSVKSHYYGYLIFGLLAIVMGVFLLMLVVVHVVRTVRVEHE